MVSHGAVMAALRAHAAGHFESTPTPTSNCCGYVLTWQAGAWGAPEDFRA